jgi:hypothetical protein
MQHAICMSFSNTAIESVVVLQAVDQKERALWEKGAVWEPPPISVTLRSLPLFADLPESLFQEIILEVRSHHLASANTQRHSPHACLTVPAFSLSLLHTV